jgi:hypothetical protein
MVRQTRRLEEPQERTDAPPAGSPTQAGDLQRIRDSGNELLDATDAAIDRALSGNAEHFLSDCRKEGGQ